MANLDISERRLPQERAHQAAPRLARRSTSRVSILPTIFGEKAVLPHPRQGIASSSTSPSSASTRGATRSFTHAIHQPYGMVLINGADGLGQDDHAVLGDLDDQLAEHTS